MYNKARANSSLERKGERLSAWAAVLCCTVLGLCWVGMRFMPTLFLRFLHYLQVLCNQYLYEKQLSYQHHSIQTRKRDRGQCDDRGTCDEYPRNPSNSYFSGYSLRI